MPPTNSFLPLAFEKLLRFIQPAFFGSVFVSRRGLYRFDTRLHRAGRLLIIAETRVRTSHQIETFGIVLTSIEKLLQSVARVRVLSGRDVRGTNLAPDFILRVRLIA